MPSPLGASFRLEKSFPEEYAARRREEQEAAAAAAAADGATDAPLPLFVMSLLLPGARLCGWAHDWLAVQGWGVCLGLACRSTCGSWPSRRAPGRLPPPPRPLSATPSGACLQAR